MIEWIGWAVWHLIVSGLSTLGFAILFQVPPKYSFWCAVTGAVGWLTYQLIMLTGAGPAVSSLIAVIPLTLLCRFFSIWCKTPTTVFLFTGIFPLVPGAGIYYTAYHFIMSETELFFSKGMETFKVAIAMAVGIAITLSVPIPGLPNTAKRH